MSAWCATAKDLEKNFYNEKEIIFSCRLAILVINGAITLHDLSNEHGRTSSNDDLEASPCMTADNDGFDGTAARHSYGQN